jgi:4-hydroxy-tetrahydrodipicolinate reductase
MIKICVSGSKGKMGSRIIELAKRDPRLQVSGEFDIGTDPTFLIKGCDCLIEFTAPKATIEHVALAAGLNKPCVIGTTGLDTAGIDKLKEASAKVPIVFSSNMSVGVNVLFKLVEDAARALGPDYGIRIKEAHHIHKKDAPSGTAKTLAVIMQKAGGKVEKQIESIREGQIIGDHTVIFEGPLDKIELFHGAKSRDIFAIGALEAAKFVVGKPAKLYNMREVLGI